MSTNTDESQDPTFDDLSLRSVSRLETRIVALRWEVSATEGALAASKASLANFEVLLDGARAQSDATGSRLGDARNAAASVLGAIKASHRAQGKSGNIRGLVHEMLTSASDASSLVLAAIERIDELVNEVQTYGKNHYVPATLMDGVAKAQQSSQVLVGAMVEAVETAMNAYLGSWRAETAATALDGIGREVWTQLDSAESDPDQLKGISHLELGQAEIDSIEKLAAVVSKGSHSRGLLHVLKNTHSIARAHEIALEAAVAQSRLEVNTLEQRLATTKAAARSAQLALEGAQATLGTAF